MGVDTAIQWCHHTFNGWIGCTERGPECLNCYAREQNKFYKWNGGGWGPGALRKITSPSKWREPIAWNAAAEKAGERRRVFCHSLADVADAEAPMHAYPWLWALVEATPWLDWLFLTKRPERIRLIVPPAWHEKPPRNAWWGTSVGTQKTAQRAIGDLIDTPAAIHFLSMEPLLEHVDLSAVPPFSRSPISAEVRRHLRNVYPNGLPANSLNAQFEKHRIDWVIVGGESGGSKARPFHLAWARSIRDQCRTAGVPYFFKQAGDQARANFYDDETSEFVESRGGDWSPIGWDERDGQPRPDALVSLKFGKKKGGAIEELPPDLRVREFPAP